MPIVMKLQEIHGTAVVGQGAQRRKVGLDLKHMGNMGLINRCNERFTREADKSGETETAQAR